MRVTRLTVAAVGAVPLLIASTVQADACDPRPGSFTPGSWQGHGFAEFEEADIVGVMVGHREVRFDVTFDGGGVVTGGSFTMGAWAANVADGEQSGSEASWSVVGELSGVVGAVQVDGTADMDMVIAQEFTDVNGEGQVGTEYGDTGERPTTFTFAADAADCTMAVGTVDGPGIGAEVPWTAVRVAKYRGPSPSERYEELTRRAVSMSSADEVYADDMLTLLRDLLALTQSLASSDDCSAATSANGRLRSPHVAYASWLLRTALTRFVEMIGNYDTPTVVQVLTLGFQVSGLQGELCDGTYRDDTGLIALVDAEMLARLRQTVVDDDADEFRQIAAAAYQLSLPETTAALAQMAPLP